MINSFISLFLCEFKLICFSPVKTFILIKSKLFNSLSPILNVDQANQFLFSQFHREITQPIFHTTPNSATSSKTTATFFAFEYKLD